MQAKQVGAIVPMTTPEVAERLGVDPSTVYRWVLKGMFPNAYKKNPMIDRSPWLIPEEDVVAFEEKRKGHRSNDSQSHDG